VPWCDVTLRGEASRSVALRGVALRSVALSSVALLKVTSRSAFNVCSNDVETTAKDACLSKGKSRTRRPELAPNKNHDVIIAK
jgi:hypothetical protein